MRLLADLLCLLAIQGASTRNSSCEGEPSLLHLRARAATPRSPNDPSRRKNIIWIHLHNFGGTWVSEQAVQQGELQEHPNGNVMPDLCGYGEFKGCADRDKSDLTFSSIERYIRDSDLECDSMLYGVSLRDPLSGSKSTFVNNKFDAQDKKSILDAIVNKNMGLITKHTRRSHKCLPEWSTYQHFDNFATRTLSGEYFADPGRVSSKHLQKAKERLQKMHVVMVLEDLEEHVPQLAATFGWDVSSSDARKPANSHSGTESIFTSEEEEFLKKVNKFDYELYSFGKSLAANLTAQAVTALSEKM